MGQPTKDAILAALATLYSDDIDFLDKVNNMTFGLLKQSNIRRD